VAARIQDITARIEVDAAAKRDGHGYQTFDRAIQREGSALVHAKAGTRVVQA